MIRNVLEHVAAADPELRNGELSEHDEIERDTIRAKVLASGLPAPTVARPRRRRAPLALAAMAAGAAIAVGVAAAGRDASFVDRAYAAIGSSGLFHVVEEGSIDAPHVVFEHEPFSAFEESRAPRTRMEAWYDRADRASHFIHSVRRGARWVRDYESAWKDGKSLIRWGPDGPVGVSRYFDDESTARDESADPTSPTNYYAVSLFETAYRDDKVRDDGVDGGLVAHVAGQHRLVVALEVEAEHGRAAVPERLRRRAADPAAGAGDEHARAHAGTSTGRSRTKRRAGVSSNFAGSKRRVRRRNRHVQSGHSVGLRPVASRYQLAQPVFHTVPCIRASISRV